MVATVLIWKQATRKHDWNEVVVLPPQGKPTKDADLRGCLKKQTGGGFPLVFTVPPSPWTAEGRRDRAEEAAWRGKW